MRTLIDAKLQLSVHTGLNKKVAVVSTELFALMCSLAVAGPGFSTRQ